MRVLLVEDSAPVRERLRDLLVESAAADVSEAASVEAACQLLGQWAFDAAVIDVRLGAGSGLALISIIRARQPGVLVVILTNDPTEGHRRECQRRGADLFFDKSREFQQAMAAVSGRPAGFRSECRSPDVPATSARHSDPGGGIVRQGIGRRADSGATVPGPCSSDERAKEDGPRGDARPLRPGLPR